MKHNNLIGFIGQKRSGKDSAANALATHGWKIIKYADGLKTMLRAYLAYVGVAPDHIEQMLEGSLKEVPNAQFCGHSTRWAMQSLGTEWGRDLIGKNIWINATLAHAAALDRPVAISDCRFPNEAKAIKDAGGVVIRIHRDGLAVDSHPSEQLIASIPEDYTIYNNGTLDDLHRKVLQLINQ